MDKMYYVQTSVNMSPKNKAWKELQDFAHEQNGTLIHGEMNMRAFIAAVSSKIDHINEKYPRCTNLIFKTETRINTVIYAMVRPDDAFTMTLLPIKREILSFSE